MKRILLSISLCIGLSAGVNAQIQNYTVGQTVSNFTVTDIDGNQHDLYTYTAQGKWVVLDFFFDTCPPCQSTAPIFNELHEKYGCNAGDVVCISMNNGSDNDAQVAAFESTYGGSFSHAPAVSNDGGAGNVDTDFNPSQYPTYCLIGADNTLKSADIWPLSSVADFESAFTAAGFSPSPMSCAVSVNEVTGLSNIKVFPNPANDRTTLNFSMEEGNDVMITITNLLGAQVDQITVSGTTGHNTVNLNTSALANGQYMIQCAIDNKVLATQKLSVIK